MHIDPESPHGMHVCILFTQLTLGHKYSSTSTIVLEYGVYRTVHAGPEWKLRSYGMTYKYNVYEE